MLNFRIDTFLAVCRHMNFTQAAKELNITQPAVSQHIKYLEDEYQTKFFHSEGKKLQLTSSGKLFYEKASTMKYDELFLREKLKRADFGNYPLKLGATFTIGEFILPNKLGEFLNNNVEIELTLTVGNTRCLLQQLDHGEIDLALIEGYFPKNEYSFANYSREKYICIAGSNYVFKKPPHLLEDLTEETLILREDGSGTRDIFEKNLERQNLLLNDFSKKIEIGSISAIKKLVEENIGITTLYEVIVAKELASGRIKKVRIEDLQKYHDFYFVWRKKSIFSELFKQLATKL